nr:glycosyltransferase [Aeromicrobium phragmitis]
MDESDVVICHAGQDVIAEVSARRRPAVIIPRERPHEEELCAAEALRRGAWPALVSWSFPARGWPELLDEARSLDGAAWSSWCDGLGARRFAATLQSLVLA